MQFGFMFGGSISSRVLLAGSGGGSLVTDGDKEASLGSASAVLQVYPHAEGRLFLRVGVGMGSAEFNNGEGGDKEKGMTLTVLTSHVEVGWDLWRSGRRSIGPYVGGTISGKFAGPWRIGTGLDMVDVPRNPHAIYFGFGVTWY
jgi:hypothetical protein